MRNGNAKVIKKWKMEAEASAAGASAAGATVLQPPHTVDQFCFGKERGENTHGRVKLTHAQAFYKAKISYN